MQESRSQWQIVFALTAVVFFVGNLVYLIWGTTDLQPWDAVDFMKKNDVELDNNNIKAIKDNEKKIENETKSETR